MHTNRRDGRGISAASLNQCSQLAAGEKTGVSPSSELLSTRRCDAFKCPKRVKRTLAFEQISGKPRETTASSENNSSTETSGRDRRTELKNSSRRGLFSAIEHNGKRHQNGRGAGRALLGTVANAAAILAKVRGREWNV
jgi:hypothetical protein